MSRPVSPTPHSPTRRPVSGARQAPGARLLAALLLSSLALSLVACAPEAPGEPEKIETVEITGGPTSAMTADSDEVAASDGSEDLIGVLPGGLPETLPLPTPASVVDFGTENDRFVVLRTTLSREAAQSQLASKLDRAGWAVAGDRWTRTKGRDRVVFRFERGEAGQTLVRVEY